MPTFKLPKGVLARINQMTVQRNAIDAHIAEMVFVSGESQGFEGEIEEVIRCVRAGLSQSSRMPLTETLSTLACIDELRRQLGVRYPFE